MSNETQDLPTGTPGEDPLLPKRRKPGRPPKTYRPPGGNTSEEGLPQGEIRYTIIMGKQDLLDMQAMAYWDRKNVRDVFNEAVVMYLRDYVKKNGKIKPHPKKI